MGSVILLQLDTIGLINMHGILIRVCIGGVQNSNHAYFIFNALSFSVISSFSVGEMSMCNGSYTLRLFRCIPLHY